MKRFIIWAIFTIMSVSALAQASSAEYSRYMEEVGNSALFYRTKEALKYPFLYEGTYFAYDKDYLKGMVRLGGKDYFDLLLNLDANSDDLDVKANGYLVEAVTLPKRLVDFFVIGKRNFVNIRYGNSVMKAGYYEVIYSSDAFKLYKKNNKRFKEELLSEGRNSRFIKKFEADNQYYLVNDEGTFQIKNKRSLMSRFPRERREVKKKMNAFNVGQSDGYTIQELEFQEILNTIENK